ncbi:MAG: glycosyltransferase [Bacteroidota bacterium]
MKVLHINTRDISGGAALSLYEIHRQISSMGISSDLLVQDRRSNDPSVVGFRYSRKLTVRARRFLYGLRIRFEKAGISRRFMRKNELFSGHRAPYTTELTAQLDGYDLIVLNWVSDMIDYRAFFSYVKARRIPVIWRLADLNPLTGGCHYTYECRRYETGCGSCPMLSGKRAKDQSYRIWKEKERILAGVPTGLLHLVTLSSWESGMASRSGLFGRFPLTQISNGVDLSVFSRKDKAGAKRLLGIPENRFTLLLVAEFLETEYKGTGLAFEALKQLGNPGNYFLLIVGNISAVPFTGMDYHSFGKVSDRKSLSVIYNAADVFIFPSLYETFGRTFLEAMACGAAFAGFASGGAADIVENGVDGYITEVKDSEHLRLSIGSCCSSAEILAKLQNSAAQKAAQYEIGKVAGKYLDLYREVASTCLNY